jgi:hypothetical protein
MEYEGNKWNIWRPKLQFAVYPVRTVYNPWNWDCPGKRTDCHPRVSLMKSACCVFCSQNFDFQENGWLYLTLIHDLLAELELTYKLKFMDFMNVVVVK